jgi:hypothetical protein
VYSHGNFAGNKMMVLFCFNQNYITGGIVFEEYKLV